ncbi:SNF2-related protein, partial [Chloroflexota bacterium]
MDNSNLVNQKLHIPKYFVTPVFVESAETEGDLVFLRVRTDAGRLEELTLTIKEINSALQATIDETTTLIPADDQFLLIEAERIRLAYAYDPHFAVSLSGIEPLPHQLEAVYEHLLPQTRLRFLLADDPGAGKTIMAGLLIKELKMRGAIERILVLCPAPLTIQWQDEMRTKFDEVFEIIRSELAKDQLAGNVWQRFPQCIASIDFAKRDDIAPDLLRADWDLVIIDEAHKCAARWFSGEIKRTKRYALAEALSTQADRLLLLTATPHSGDVEQFAYFLRLLDSDQFVGPDRVKNFAQLNQQALIPHGDAEQSPWFLRRVKEELRNFDGEKLFTQRHAITIPFTLSAEEKRLYDAVTDYINTYLPRQTGRRKAPVALARTVLQRRLASSVRSIRRSLERRYERFNTVLKEVEVLPTAKQAQYLSQHKLLEPFDDEQDIDDFDDFLNEMAATSITAAERINDLAAEVAVLQQLVKQAQQLESREDERKLQALVSCLEKAEFDE